MFKLLYAMTALIVFSSVALASEDTLYSAATEAPVSSEDMSTDDADYEEFFEEEDHYEDITSDETELDDDELQGSEIYNEALQIGSAFERTFLEPGDEVSLQENLQKAALSAAEFGTGSAFYIGEFEGRHIMGTNAHVMMAFADEVSWTAEDYNQNLEESCKIFPGVPESEPKYIRFSLVEKEYDCKRLLGVWPEIDFALFEIEVKDGFSFKNMGVSLAQNKKHHKDQALSMYSYGSYLNPGSLDFSLASSEGELCRVFSDEERLLSDSDENEDGVWSFATGCDISTGDSGSAIIDSKTGLITGVIWAGAGEKSAQAKEDTHLLKILKSEVDGEELVWSQMNYGVPILKILGGIEKDLKTKQPQDQKVLKAVLSL